MQGAINPYIIKNTDSYWLKKKIQKKQDIQWAILKIISNSFINYKKNMIIGEIYIWSWILSSNYLSFKAFKSLKTLATLNIFKYELEITVSFYAL